MVKSGDKNQRGEGSKDVEMEGEGGENDMDGQRTSKEHANGERQEGDVKMATESAGQDYEYFTVEIEGGDEQLLEGDVQYRIIGLETDTPYLQLRDKTYEGHYEYVLGTHLYFDEHKNAESFADRTRDGVTARYHGLSTKKIVFRPVALVPKDSSKK